MKFLVLLVIVGGVLWLMFGRRGRVGNEPPKSQAPKGPVEMVACAHCGVNLPRTEALQDGTGRNFCSDAHRAAGPR